MELLKQRNAMTARPEQTDRKVRKSLDRVLGAPGKMLRLQRKL